MARKTSSSTKTKTVIGTGSNKARRVTSSESHGDALAGEPEGDAIEAAQDIMYDAWEADDQRKRVALARKALKISPFCADAYVLLAQETARSLDEAIDLYRRGVEAGEKTLGKAAFRDDVGDFWGLLETRPYMRARHGLALSLWEKGLRDEAVIHCEDMLRLNPNDNQGIRYLLLDCLLVLGRDDQAARLLADYEDDGAAAWGWSRALLSFRRSGGSAESGEALAEAIAANKHVPAYLLGRKKMPRQLPLYIGWGDESEAIAYAHGAAEAWASTPGALAWLQLTGSGASPVPQGGSLTEPGIDLDRIDDAILALLQLGLHDGWRAWKTFDWDAMDRLYRKGFISNPVGKAKSVELTEEGAAKSKQLFRKLFGRP